MSSGLVQVKPPDEIQTLNIWNVCVELKPGTQKLSELKTVVFSETCRDSVEGAWRTVTPSGLIRKFQKTLRRM